MIEHLAELLFSSWRLTMFSVLVFIAFTGQFRSPKLRVWCVMMAASLAGNLYQSIGFYIAIDAVAALIIMAPPKTGWQRAIGSLFVMMMMCTLGYSAASQLALHNILSAAPDPILLSTLHNGLSWLAVALLIGWTGSGLRSTNSNRYRRVSRLLPYFARRSQEGQKAHHKDGSAQG